MANDGAGGLPTDKARDFQRQMAEQRGKPGVGDDRGVVEKVWMGSETEGWKARREREDMEKLKNGEGYGDIIMDQIWEVWNWGKTKEEGKVSAGSDGDKKA